MGQLERYGLYVLCVVIVLILGVAIWGGDGTVQAAGPKMRPLEQLATNPQARSTDAGEPRSSGPVRTPPPADPTPDTFYDHRTSTSFDELDQLAGVAGVVEVDPAGGQPASPDAGEPKEEKKPDPVSALRTYTVKRGDTMEGIAVKLLGSRKQTATIRKLNPDVNPKKMRPGIVLKLPWNESIANSATKGDGKWRQYKVKSGDNASAISIEMYGTAKYANRILEVNGIEDAGKMMPNTVLKIPPVQ